MFYLFEKIFIILKKHKLNKIIFSRSFFLGIFSIIKKKNYEETAL